MKKIACFIIAVLTSLAAASCADAPSPLSYQGGAVSVRCTVSFGDEEFGIVLFPSEGKIEVTSPDEIAGASLLRQDGKFFLDPGDGAIELPAELLPLSDPLFDSFSLPGQSAARSTSGDDEQVLRIPAQEGEYTVKLSADGAPGEISYKGARDFTLRDIEIIYENSNGE